MSSFSSPTKTVVNFTLTALSIFVISHASAGAQVYTEYPKNGGKVQALQLTDIPNWMTFDMDLRTRAENQTSLSYTSGDDQFYDLTRVRVGLELRPTKWLTGYLQVHDTHALALPLQYVAANMRDTFDLRQGYAQFNFKPITLVAGRQELKYGGERLVGISNWTNNSRTWDGFLGRIGDKNRLDLFSTSVVAIHPTSLDKHGAGLTFHGAVGTITTWVPHTTVTPFVFIRAVPAVISQQGVSGAETEVTPGIEVERTLPAGFDYHFLGAIQRGSYSNDSIHAGAAFVKAGYTVNRLPWHPRLRGEYDYATGNPHRNPARISTFDQQYPSNHNAFGLTDLFGFQNIKEIRANFYLNPLKPLTVLLQQEWLNVATTQDSVYTGSGSILVKAPTSGFLRSGLGREFDASAAYVYREYLVINAGVGHFSPDGLMLQTSHGAPLTISYVSLTYRFRVDRKPSE